MLTGDIIYARCVSQEYCKPVLQTGSPAQVQVVRNILYWCVDAGLRMLSPFMPFITEELYQRLTRRDNTAPSISVAQFPLPQQVRAVFLGLLDLFLMKCGMLLLLLFKITKSFKLLFCYYLFLRDCIE